MTYRRRLVPSLLLMAVLLAGACGSSDEAAEESTSDCPPVALTAVETALKAEPAAGQMPSNAPPHVPPDVYANFYGFAPGSTAVTDAGLVRAATAVFNSAPNAAPPARSVTEMVGEFKDADAAGAALPLLSAQAKETLQTGTASVKDLSDLATLHIGHQYGWGWSMTMTTGQGKRVRRAEYGWQVGQFVVNVLVFSDELDDDLSPVATEVSQKLQERLAVVSPAGC